MRLAAIISMLAAPVASQEVEVPSGQPLTLHETVVVEPERRILYLGFLAPALGGDYPVTYDRAAIDMDVICRNLGLSLAEASNDIDTQIAEVVVRLMDREIAYGGTDSEAAQFISAYDISGGECLWN